MEFPSTDPAYTVSNYSQFAGEVTQTSLQADPTLTRGDDDSYFTDTFCGMETDNPVYQHAPFSTFPYYHDDTLMNTSLGNGPAQLPMLTSPDPWGFTTCGFHDEGHTNQSPLPAATLLDPWGAAEPNMVGAAPYLPEQTQTFGMQAIPGMTATPVGMGQTSVNNIINPPFRFVVQTPDSLEANAFAPLTRHGHPKPSIRPKHSEPYDGGATWLRPKAVGLRRAHDRHQFYNQPNRGRYHHTTAHDFNNKVISRINSSFY